MTYKYINYIDYLCNTVINDLKTVHSFTEPSLSIRRIDHELTFRSDLTKRSIHEQARYFATRMASILDPNCRTGRFLTDRNVKSVIKRLENAYIYSMYKVVYYHLLYEESNVSSLNLFDVGYVFSGHHALFHLLSVRYTTVVEQVEYSVIRKSITGIGTEALKDITEDEQYKSFKDLSNRFLDPESEKVLEELFLNYSHLVSVSSLHEPYPINGSNDPTGNLCVNQSGEFLLISNSESRNDVPSLYWNSALGIILTSGDLDNGNQSFYVNCGATRNSHIIPWEVQSITGLQSTCTPYPFETGGSPGRPSGMDSPSGPNLNPVDTVGGSPGNGNDYIPKNERKRVKDKPNSQRKGYNSPGRNNLDFTIRNNKGIPNRSGSIFGNNGQNNSKALFQDALNLILRPRNLEIALGAVAHYNALRINSEQIKAIQSISRNVKLEKSSFESVEATTPLLRITRSKGQSETFSKTEGGFGYT